jgi:hypothetical protein
MSWGWYRGRAAEGAVADEVRKGPKITAADGTPFQNGGW